MKRVVGGVVLGFLSTMGVMVIASQVDNAQVVTFQPDTVLSEADLNKNMQTLSSAINDNALQLQNLAQGIDFNNYLTGYSTLVYNKFTLGAVGETCTTVTRTYTSQTQPDGSVSIARKQAFSDADPNIVCGNEQTHHFRKTAQGYYHISDDGIEYDASGNPIPATLTFNYPIQIFSANMRVGGTLGGATEVASSNSVGFSSTLTEKWTLLRHVNEVKISTFAAPIPDCLIFSVSRLTASPTPAERVDWYCAGYGMVKRIGGNIWELKSAS